VKREEKEDRDGVKSKRITIRRKKAIRRILK
jgi:hypothetical protein